MTFTEDVLRLKNAEIEALKLENVRLLLKVEELKQQITNYKTNKNARQSKIYKS